VVRVIGFIGLKEVRCRAEDGLMRGKGLDCGCSSVAGAGSISAAGCSGSIGAERA